MESKKRLPHDLSIIAEVFELQLKEQCVHLQNWMNKQYNLSDADKGMIQHLFERVERKIDYFNEEELKIKLIGPLFHIAAVDVKDKIEVFFERSLSAELKDYRLSVVCDCMVATPAIFNTPKAPYFFLQEYKKQRGDKNDPEAQMLQAMLIAQHKNRKEKIVYGGFVIGRLWYFATLIGKKYCVSQPLDAGREEEIYKIVVILRHLKSFVSDLDTQSKQN